MVDWYVLDGHIPVKSTVNEASRFFCNAGERKIARTEMADNVVVSTVFLCLDHKFGSEYEPPLLFETLIFGGLHDGEIQRYSTWKDAEKGHSKMVEMLIAEKKMKN